MQPKKYKDIIKENKKNKYSLNILMAEMHKGSIPAKKKIKGKISHPFYKLISPIIFYDNE
jgi:hypothetical protein